MQWPKIVTCGAVAVMVACLSVSPAASIELHETPPGDATAPRVATHVEPSPLSQTPGCVDVTFIGARGSGQMADQEDFGMGPQVASVLRAYSRGVSGRTVAYEDVSYPSYDVAILATSKRTYFRGLDAGVAETIRLMNDRAARCPKERFVVAGYSQGAMVVHRALPRLATTLLSRIDGVILLADGDRSARQRGARRGSAGDSGHGVSQQFPSVASGRYTFSTSPFPAAVRAATVSVCAKGDVVCHASFAFLPGAPWRLRSGIRIHQSRAYIDSGDVRGAAKVAASRTMKRPSLALFGPARVDLDAAVEGEYFDEAIHGVSGGSKPYSWSLRSSSESLPSGLSLDRMTGRISGIPRESASWVGEVRITSGSRAVLDLSVALQVDASELADEVTVDGAITELPYFTAEPLFSADGDVVAYQRQGDDKHVFWQVMVVDLAHRKLFKLAPRPGEGHDVSLLDISDDGTVVLVEARGSAIDPSDAADSSQLYTWLPARGEFHRVAGRTLEDAGWSRRGRAKLSGDGGTVAFGMLQTGRTEGKAGVKVVRASATSGEILSAWSESASDRPTTWVSINEVSPDGRLVAFYLDRAVAGRDSERESFTNVLDVDQRLVYTAPKGATIVDLGRGVSDILMSVTDRTVFEDLRSWDAPADVLRQSENLRDLSGGVLTQVSKDRQSAVRVTQEGEFGLDHRNHVALIRTSPLRAEIIAPQEESKRAGWAWGQLMRASDDLQKIAIFVEAPRSPSSSDHRWVIIDRSKL